MARRSATARRKRAVEEGGAAAQSPEQEALGASTELDRLIHERVRLAIISALAVNESLSFNDLKALLSVSDGNLSVHARKLEEAGYIRCDKSFQGRFPRTDYRIERAGQEALEQYLDHMEALIRAVREV